MGPAVMSVDKFLENGLPKLDNAISERVAKASLNGNVLRYVCVIEGTRYAEGFLVSCKYIIDVFSLVFHNLKVGSGCPLHHLDSTLFYRCEVGIQELPRNSALGRLRGSDNVVSLLLLFYILPCSHVFHYWYIWVYQRKSRLS